RDAGVAVGLGLDGGAGDAPDAFANMRAAVGLQRAVSQDAAAFPRPADALRMATLGGAEALGLETQTGSLTPGKRADLIVLNAGWMNFAPRWDWPSQLVFGGQPRMVRDVLVGGEALKRNGELVGVDVAQAVADAEEASRALQERLGR
ncbi:MAG: amidohydrolase family protein, partial [Dehalococcoidia bacterium]|nr:amidohydrolase family protein [Dehalococcoidia bacterium]